MFDSKLFIAHSKVRQILYDKHLFYRDLQGIDFTNAFIIIDINKQTQYSYLSLAHDLFFHTDEYLPRVAFYLPTSIDKAGLLPTLKTSKHCAEFLKTKFLSQSTPICGWFITTSFDREISSKAFPPTMNGSLIQKKDYISEIYVFKETKNQFALVRNSAPNFVETNGQSLPTGALRLDSKNSKTDEIQFCDVGLHEPTLAEAFQRARIPKLPATVNSKEPKDVSIKMLCAFYEEAKIWNPKI